MRWQPDVSRGAWIAERLDADFGFHRVVPRGFPAYARIFHGIGADRPVGASWADVGAAADRGEPWTGGIEARTASWAEVARVTGARMHPLAQWGAISRGRRDLVDAEGWRCSPPELGRLDAEELAAVARTLARHTTTPEAGQAAVWEGWGGMFDDRSRAVLFFTPSGGASTEAPPEGLDDRPPLPREVRRGPRLRLPDREHVLFDAGIAEFADAPDADEPWPLRAPWVRTPWAAESPALVWPEDRAWVLVSEIDWDSTVVGGTPELIAELVGGSGVEALELPADADLSSTGDRLNA